VASRDVATRLVGSGIVAGNCMPAGDPIVEIGQLAAFAAERTMGRLQVGQHRKLVRTVAAGLVRPSHHFANLVFVRHSVPRARVEAALARYRRPGSAGATMDKRPEKWKP